MIFLSEFACRTRSIVLPFLNKMPTLRSATYPPRLVVAMPPMQPFECLESEQKMLLLVSGMEGWACTTGVAVRRRREQLRCVVDRGEWPAKQRIPSQGRESNKEQGWD